MYSRYKAIVAAGILGAVAGCASDRPHEYGQDRPPVDQVDPRDRGLQSYDVVAASDKMAASLLSLRELNDSATKWTIVVDHVDDLTTDKIFRHDYDIFLERLRVKLFQGSQGRIALIENKAKLQDLRGRELESQRDDFGQSGGGSAPAPHAVQPDYALYGKAMDLPNRATNYYQIEFDLTNLRNRLQIWTDLYEVRARRD